MAGHGKTLREIMGCRESFGDFQIGDMVRVITTGHVGRIDLIGPHGLISISGVIGVFAPDEVEKVPEKEKTA